MGYLFAVLASTESLDLKEETGASVARFLRLRDNPTVAEAAVTVDDDYQGRGFGRILLATLVEAAHERGIRKFRGEVLATNEPMRKLLEGAGAVGVDGGGSTLLFDVPIDTDTSDSIVRRVLAAVATSMAVWLSRLYLGPKGVSRRPAERSFTTIDVPSTAPPFSEDAGQTEPRSIDVPRGTIDLPRGPTNPSDSARSRPPVAWLSSRLCSRLRQRGEHRRPLSRSSSVGQSESLRRKFVGEVLKRVATHASVAAEATRSVHAQ